MTTKKIILIDDDQDINAQNQTALKSAGFETEIAFSAKEGFEKLENTKADLVILDVVMEYENSGLELARKISSNKELKKTPIILLTSDGNNPKWMQQDGHTWDNIVKILDKPVTPSKLVETVKKVLD